MTSVVDWAAHERSKMQMRNHRRDLAARIEEEGMATTSWQGDVAGMWHLASCEHF